MNLFLLTIRCSSFPFRYVVAVLCVERQASDKAYMRGQFSRRVNRPLILGNFARIFVSDEISDEKRGL